MNGYLLSIAGVVVLSAILSSVLPNGKTSGLIKSIMRMACILAIISPIITFFHSGSLSVSGVKNSDAIFSQSVIEQERAFIHYHREMRIAETERALEPPTPLPLADSTVTFAPSELLSHPEITGEAYSPLKSSKTVPLWRFS